MCGGGKQESAAHGLGSDMVGTRDETHHADERLEDLVLGRDSLELRQRLPARAVRCVWMVVENKSWDGRPMSVQC